MFNLVQVSYEDYVKHLHSYNHICKESSVEHIQVNNCLLFLQLLTIDSNVYSSSTSYGFKHIVEGFLRAIKSKDYDYYISNDSFKLACCILKIPYKFVTDQNIVIKRKPVSGNRLYNHVLKF